MNSDHKFRKLNEEFALLVRNACNINTPGITLIHYNKKYPYTQKQCIYILTLCTKNQKNIPTSSLLHNYDCLEQTNTVSHNDYTTALHSDTCYTNCHPSKGGNSHYRYTLWRGEWRMLYWGSLWNLCL